MKKRLEDIVKKAEDLLFKIDSDFSDGYDIAASGNYEPVHDVMGETETRMITAGHGDTVFVSRMRGRRPARKEKFDQDMEVELISGRLIYHLPNRTIDMQPMQHITIPAGTEWSYEIPSDEMRCIFKLSRKK